jgi:hypothetical protein
MVLQLYSAVTGWQLLSPSLLPDTFAKFLITQRFAENSETHTEAFERTCVELLNFQRLSVSLCLLCVLSVTDYGRLGKSVR